MRYPIRLVTVALMGGVGSFLAAQISAVRDTVVLGPGYANQVYYSLQNGAVGMAPAAGWHLAFEIPIRAAAIRANHARGVTVYATSRDTSGWAALSLNDTTFRLYNDNCRWSVGAFNQTAPPNNPFDVGWGNYNLTTHITTGDSLYIVAIGSTYKKLWIQRLQGTQYYLRTANLDGSQDTSYAVDKSLASGRAFIYLNLLTHQVLNLEPAASEWDLVFTPYLEIVSGTLYPVTGVLQNSPVRTAKVVLTSPANPDTLTPSAYAFDSCAASIGYDWKRFDMSANSFVVADTVYYLVQDGRGNLWRLRFLRFEGSSTGRLVLEKALLRQATSLASRPNAGSLAVYPVPAQESFQIELPQVPFAGKLTLLNSLGQVVWQQPVEATQAVMELVRPAGLPNGVYAFLLEGAAGRWTGKMVFQ